ncbi:hypothetical protein [Paraburkholderia caballeronis]|uniref:hypothetical protein n=1 Tax=Paraburkholderia caballeronis TaxID=416943 RepID=UPI0014304CBC|nr:hypothetical protein [Paraburkholderia caballeronis]
MKKTVIALATAFAVLAPMAAQAYPQHRYSHHHHRVCRNVHVHHHWERRCWWR